ncbi:hypothetical protein R5R35_006853 [Gryllus longicercus]|uniref:Ferric-chelate reductase 1 n=1 Tax=Gryllus longicercus TaxID=2509291 RepID=A0AAN9Z074_9ORTH
MMDRSVVAATALLLAVLLAGGPQEAVRAFQIGAPNSNKTCTTLLPRHSDNVPRAGPSPFALSAAQGARGEPLNVTITSRQGFPYKGFILQARAADDLMPIGTFVVHDSQNTQTIACFGEDHNTVTHSNPSEKTSTTFEWTPPVDFNGQVIFNATVVQDYSTFWQGVVAKALIGDPALTGSTAGISTTQPPLTTQRTSTTNAPVTMKPAINYRALSPIYIGCGSSKACFGYPNDCDVDGNCNIMMTSLERGDKYIFELMSTDPRSLYVAIGLSTDQWMGDDLVMECVVINSEVKLFQSWNIRPNPRKGNTRLPTNGNLQLMNYSHVDNTIYCQFERDADTTVNDVRFNLPTSQYYVLLAHGDEVKEDGYGGVGYHFRALFSGQQGFLSDVTGFKAASKLLLRLHGAFMIAAWIGAASIGIVLARYFKQTWTGSQLCGKDQWFAWHRIFMVLVWSLTIAAFVIIFVDLKSWASSSKNHAILGVITTALAFFQPIGAIFRPSPDSRRRPIFNWLHWFVGNSAHILGIVAIFLAGQLPKAELPSWWIWIMVGYVAFHVIMHLMFSVAGCISERQSSKRINSFPLKEMSSSRTPLSSAERRQEAPHACFRKFLLALYIFGILVITIALIVIAVLAPIESNSTITNFQNWISTNRSG